VEIIVVYANREVEVFAVLALTSVTVMDLDPGLSSTINKKHELGDDNS
jgi:hypothetical protein